MYGNAAKCQDQLDSDAQFLLECNKQHDNRTLASKQYVDWAWNYFYKNEFDSAIMRFNQAWLLDSLNADVYWGFGNIEGMRGNFDSSLKYLESSLKLNPNNAKVWESASSSYGQQFYSTKDKVLLNKSIDYLKKSVELDPTSARTYGQLAAAYSYFYQKDSARKYLDITDKIDPSAINPEVRKLLTE